MKQVLQNLSSGETILEDVPAPASSSGRLTIHSSRTLISAGTEKMLVEFGQAGLIGKARAQPEKVKQVLNKIRTDGLMPTLDAVFSKLGEPLPLGYCNAGRVTSVGSGVTGFEVGDRVVSNGPHAELVSVAPLLCAKIPDSVDDDQASFTVLASIGLQGIRLLQPTLGETVVVYGLGLIGLVAVQLLQANGCRVIGVDISPTRLGLASEFGASVINGRECDDVAAAVNAMTGNRGADAVLITASAKTDAIISDSAKMCRKRGRVVLVGVVGLNINRSDFYEKEITFQVSCSYGPGRYDPAYEQHGHDYPVGFVRWTEQRNFEAILEMLAAGRLDFSKLLTHRFSLENAPDAYKTIQENRESLGVVLEYPSEVQANQTIRISSASAQATPANVVCAVVGAGNFTRATLMPALAKLPVKLKYVAGRSSVGAVQHVAKKFSVEHATTDLDQVLGDSEVNWVVITTNHDSHAALACQALAAGKHVLVEKPLTLSVKQLQAVVQASEENPNLQVMVGFNRRFSPHAVKCKQLVRGRAEPIAVNMVMNAGFIPPDHWVHDRSVGGGRIVGEACHFIDLLVYLAGSKVKSVAAHRLGSTAAVRDDKMSISIELEDGSIGSINYFANGSKAYPKESIDVFSDGRVLQLDNFRKTIGYDFQGFKKFATSRQEKGHAQQFQQVVASITNGAGSLIPLDELVNVTLASFAAVDAARQRRLVNLNEEYGHLFP